MVLKEFIKIVDKNHTYSFGGGYHPHLGGISPTLGGDITHKAVTINPVKSRL